MQTDKLTDIEELLHYRKYYRSRKTWTVIVGILSFLLGVACTDAYYRYFN